MVDSIHQTKGKHASDQNCKQGVLRANTQKHVKDVKDVEEVREKDIKTCERHERHGNSKRG